MTDAPFWQQLAFWTASASLLWNFANTLRTEYLQRENRRRATKLDEFRTQVRGPILAALTTLNEQRKLVEALTASGKTCADKRGELVELNATLVAAIGQLRDELQRANQSQFAGKSDWLEGFEDLEDQCLTLVDRATSGSRPEHDFNPTVVRLGETISKISSNCNKRAESEIATYIV